MVIIDSSYWSGLLLIFHCCHSAKKSRHRPPRSIHFTTKALLIVPNPRNYASSPRHTPGLRLDNISNGPPPIPWPFGVMLLHPWAAASCLDVFLVPPSAISRHRWPIKVISTAPTSGHIPYSKIERSQFWCGSPVQ